MTTVDVTPLIYEAASALRAGERRTARMLLTQALAEDPENERALLWMSGAVDSAAQQRACLERVLVINPDNQAARDGLDWLNSLETAEPPAEWSPPAPIPAAKLAMIPVACYACGAQLYGKATFCWRCHVAVHVCANCEFAPEARCKELQAIHNLTLANTCEWWRPS